MTSLKDSWVRSVVADPKRLRVNLVIAFSHVAVVVLIIFTTLTYSTSVSMSDLGYLDMVIEIATILVYLFVFFLISLILVKTYIKAYLLVGLALSQYGILLDTLDLIVDAPFVYWYILGDALFLVGSIVLLMGIANWVAFAHYLTTRDPLTGIYNRRFFDSFVSKFLLQNSRLGVSAVLVAFDLDDFKQVNDTYGHSTGDKVLQFFARELLATFRESDVVCRMGGEEFEVLMVNVNSGQAVKSINRFWEHFNRNMPDNIPKVTASIGIADMLVDDSVEKLRARADKAMYKAKNSGKAKYIVWQKETFLNSA